MPFTKNLYLPDELRPIVELAEEKAQKQGTSLSALFQNYLRDYVKNDFETELHSFWKEHRLQTSHNTYITGHKLYSVKLSGWNNLTPRPITLNISEIKQKELEFSYLSIQPRRLRDENSGCEKKLKLAIHSDDLDIMKDGINAISITIYKKDNNVLVYLSFGCNNQDKFTPMSYFILSFKNDLEFFHSFKFLDTLDYRILLSSSPDKKYDEIDIL
jgi:hypothetical protein